MKVRREVELSEEAWRWLEAYASERGQSLDEYLEYAINYFRADTSSAALRSRIKQLEAVLATRSPGHLRPTRPARSDPKRKWG